MRDSIQRVLVVEPQFRGLVHSTFNSYLLEAVSHAWPGAELCFAADPSHLAEVTRLFDISGSGNHNPLKQQPIEIGPRLKPSRQVEFKISRDILQIAAARDADLVFLTSATWAQLVGLSFCPRGAELRGVVAALHSNSNQFRGRGLRANLSAAVRRRLLERLSPLRGLVTFSEGARASAARNLGSRRLPVLKLDPPYRRSACSRTMTHQAGESLTIGWLGNTRKGDFETFLAAARRVRTLRADVDFILIGYLNSDIRSEDLAVLSVPPSREMLSRDRYEELLRQADYVVLWSNAERYEHRISAAFLDAIVFEVPGIYLESPFLREYFSRFGEMGALCNTANDLEHAIMDIAIRRNLNAPLHWSQNLSCAAKALEPFVVAGDLKVMLAALLDDSVL